jgi:hypothetical protein
VPGRAVDPRSTSSREIAPAAGAVRELARAGELLRALLDAREETVSRLTDDVGKRIAGIELPASSSLVLFGSWGRQEVTRGSDYDWGLLVADRDVALDGPMVAQAIEALRVAFEDRPPGKQQYFGTAFYSDPLSESIGLDSDDTRNLTRRMLLLLESTAVTGPEVRQTTIEAVLERYVENHRNFRPPRFFVNDVIRYWRTICVDFEGKLKQDAAHGEDDRFVMRNAKLRTSRKMLYASGLLPLLLCQYVTLANIRDFLLSQLSAPATDRVARAFVHLGQPDEALRMLAAYNEWLELLGDESKRDQLKQLDRSTRFESAVFKQVQSIGERLDQALTGLLFESDIAALARKYVAI